MSKNFVRPRSLVNRFGARTTAVICFLAILLAPLARPLWAGGTGSSELMYVQGGDAPTANGDAVTNDINAPYRFYIEVPPSPSRLVVELFDADMGTEARSANRDWNPFGTDTTISYRLFNPMGVAQPVNFSSGGNGIPAGADNAWLTFFDTDAPAAPTFEGEDTDVAGLGVGLITVPIPGPPCAAGDLLLAVIATDGNQNINQPIGWSTVDQGSASGDAARLEVFSRIATGLEIGGSQAFTWPGLLVQAAGGVLCYGGVDAVTPVNASNSDTGTSNAPTAPSVTPTVANTRIVRFYAADDGDLAGTPFPASHTGRFNIESSTGGGEVSLGAADRSFATANVATGTAAFSLSSNEQWRAVTVALAGTEIELMSGHWEVRIDQSSQPGQDFNAIGLRAHDGDSTSGGTEYNVYAESFTTYGTNGGGSGTDPEDSRSYTQYPYITSGCELDMYEFDWDANSTTPADQGSVGFLTRDGSAAATFGDSVLSGNDAWDRHTVPPWTTASDADNYGIWTMPVTISSGNSTANYGNVMLRNDQLLAVNPNMQPEFGSFDIYFANDAGAAPTKPYLEQFARYRDGANPPALLQPTRMTITVRFTNPTPYPVAFSAPAHLITSNVPGLAVLYGGNAGVSAGTILSQPLLGVLGDVVWNPGTVAAGDAVLLFYDVVIIPVLPGSTEFITGVLGLGGTNARYVDETCAGAGCTGSRLLRATNQLGPLCPLSVTTDVLTYVKIDRFDSYLSREGLVLEWESASESGTMGYELWRSQGEEWVPVRGGDVPALFGAPQGGIYRVIDPEGSAGDEYLLMERDLRGMKSSHGPYLAAPERYLAVEMASNVTSEALQPEAPLPPKSIQSVSEMDRDGVLGRPQ
ncbi:MAG: hypothetical protein K8J08_14340, partial [Thermoanaerobaculia bacterium]|nr:hypothetical protein [Thermoanaerobaculia bacterium]